MYKKKDCTFITKTLDKIEEKLYIIDTKRKE